MNMPIQPLVDATSSAILVGLALLFVASIAGAAPPEPSRVGTDIEIGRPKRSATAPAMRTSIANAARDEQPACNRPRRRLWIEGEGWIVRRVLLCH
jgi:hypothetical protein